MKIAVLSDIHSNYLALKSVLSAVSSIGVDAIIIAGDLVGYYFDPKPVLQLIRSHPKPIYIVRGNHEDMLARACLSTEELERITSQYGPGIEIALRQLSDSDIEWLTKLPHPLEITDFDRSILLCHGSPRAIDEYVYPDTSFEDIMMSMSQVPDIIIMGHTHYPYINQLNGCLILNPGSVGQPRNRQPGAHWALLDTQTLAVQAFIEPYDVSVLIESCQQHASAFPYLQQVLSRS